MDENLGWRSSVGLCLRPQGAVLSYLTSAGSDLNVKLPGLALQEKKRNRPRGHAARPDSAKPDRAKASSGEPCLHQEGTVRRYNPNKGLRWTSLCMSLCIRDHGWGRGYRRYVHVCLGYISGSGRVLIRGMLWSTSRATTAARCRSVGGDGIQFWSLDGIQAAFADYPRKSDPSREPTAADRQHRKPLSQNFELSDFFLHAKCASLEAPQS